MNASSENSALATARANIYRFLASIFRAPPTEELLRRVRAAEFRAAFADWVEPLAWNGAGAESLDALGVEYNRLFVVPRDDYVPPYESVYTDVVDIEYTPHMVSGAGALGVPTRAGELLWGPSTAAVQRAYAEAGFAVARAAGEPPDHIGIELQFLARLCDEQASAWSADDAPEATRLARIEREFLRAHPLRWIARFRTRVDAARALPFYRVFARLGESFLHSSAALLDQLE
ncbi:MAG: molecular chaperone TorD family protein [Chloroflexi bacterium]|nr:molecular chaperone TorD family protein [Chloroflexota bacterium]